MLWLRPRSRCGGCRTSASGSASGSQGLPGQLGAEVHCHHMDSWNTVSEPCNSQLQREDSAPAPNPLVAINALCEAGAPLCFLPACCEDEACASTLGMQLPSHLPTSVAWGLGGGGPWDFSKCWQPNSTSPGVPRLTCCLGHRIHIWIWRRGQAPPQL